VRPGERDADDGHGEQDRRDEVTECQPPSGEKQPYDVADHPQRAGADIFAAEIFVARYGLVAERQQRVGGDAERGSRPGQADNSDRHDDGGDHPAERHPQAAADDPEQVEKEGDEGHRDAATDDALITGARGLATPVTAARFAGSRATTRRMRRRPVAPRRTHRRALRCRACAR